MYGVSTWNIFILMDIIKTTCIFLSLLQKYCYISEYEHYDNTFPSYCFWIKKSSFWIFNLKKSIHMRCTTEFQMVIYLAPNLTMEKQEFCRQAHHGEKTGIDLHVSQRQRHVYKGMLFGQPCITSVALTSWCLRHLKAS